MAGQDAAELVAGADGELGEDLVQVVLDGARAHEQLGGDLRVGQAVGGQPGDLGLPGGQLEGGLGGALAYSLAGGPQLARGPLGEPVRPMAASISWAAPTSPRASIRPVSRRPPPPSSTLA